MSTQRNVRRLLKKKKVLEVTDLSFPTVWKKCRNKTFPLPVMIDGETRWYEDEIISWQESLERAKYKAAEAEAVDDGGDEEDKAA